ncbi:MAG: hypothetical protein J0L78_09220 [Planctomycetes bacterium]|nr:hypothetical protein [Planctomycetota bacterium]
MTSLIDDLSPASTGPQTATARPRRSYGPLGAGIAALIGVAGLALASWSVYENTRPAPRPKSASDVVRSNEGPGDGERRVDRSAGDPKPDGKERVATSQRRRAMPGMDVQPEFVENPQFTPVRTAEESTSTVAALGAAAGEQSTRIAGLTNTPLQTSDQINAALVRFLGPLAQGEVRDGAGFLKENGGKPPETGSIPGIVQQIASVLRFCELDTTHTRVRQAPKIEGPIADMLAKLPGGAVPMMINQNRSGDGDEVSSLMMPLTGLFQGSTEGIPADAPRVEVSMPARLKGEQFDGKKFLLGIILVKNTRTGTWVPQSLQFHSNDGETIKALSKTIRPRSASAGDGSPPPKAPSDRG